MSGLTRRRGTRWDRVALVALSLSLGFLFTFLYDLNCGVEQFKWLVGINRPFNPKTNRTVMRKLLGIAGEKVTDRMGESCTKDNIVVYQGATTPLPDGIPTYTVQILNECVSGCSVSDIHVSCGWFSSARLINPRVFRRLGFDDCLVNDGAALGPGGSLSFEYANTYQYPLCVSSVGCY